jgi:hypothetical protein
MKRFTMATVLACLLSVSAMAGNIPCDFAPPPPPPEGIQSSSGDIPTGGVAGQIPCDGLAQQTQNALLDGFFAVVGWLA